MALAIRCHDQFTSSGRKPFGEWTALFAKYKAAFPADAAEFERMMAGELPASYFETVPKYTTESPTKATRQTSQQVRQLRHHF